jgi:SAM-dependent methyltransferase
MSLEEKFSRMAWGFSERSYANLDAFMGRRLDLILRWGALLNPGDRVLELGCGDGYLGCLLAKCGMDYRGVDIAPGMVEAARERARAQGVNAWFGVMDIHDPSIEDSFDAIIALMRTFFAYTREPLKVLRWMRSHASKKIIVDWNHFCPLPLREAIQYVRMAGFGHVAVRPFLVPTSRKIPAVAQRALYVLESWPRIGLFLTRKKFSVLIKGEP